MQQRGDENDKILTMCEDPSAGRTRITRDRLEDYLEREESDG
jgi:hypothetical protein